MSSGVCRVCVHARRQRGFGGGVGSPPPTWAKVKLLYGQHLGSRRSNLYGVGKTGSVSVLLLSRVSGVCFVSSV